MRFKFSNHKVNSAGSGRLWFHGAEPAQSPLEDRYAFDFRSEPEHIRDGVPYGQDLDQFG